MRLQSLNMRGIRTQAVFGNNHFEVVLGVELTLRVILTKLGNKALGRIAFTVIFLGAILLRNRFGHQGNQFQPSDMKSRLSG